MLLQRTARLGGGGVLLRFERRAARLGGSSVGDAPLRLVDNGVLLQVGGDVLLRLDWRIARLGGDGGGDALLWLVGGGVLLRLDQRAARLGGGSIGDAPLGLVVNVEPRQQREHVLQPRSSSVGEASFFIRLSTFFCLARKSKFAG